MYPYELRGAVECSFQGHKGRPNPSADSHYFVKVPTRHTRRTKSPDGVHIVQAEPCFATAVSSNFRMVQMQKFIGLVSNGRVNIGNRVYHNQRRMYSVSISTVVVSHSKDCITTHWDETIKAYYCDCFKGQIMDILRVNAEKKLTSRQIFLNVDLAIVAALPWAQSRLGRERCNSEVFEHTLADTNENYEYHIAVCYAGSSNSSKRRWRADDVRKDNWNLEAGS